MGTYSAKEGSVERAWWIVDLEGKTLGRVASQIASILRGKHKPEFTPHVDTGDFVVCINAEKVHLTGRKWSQKLYHRYSGFPGGLRSVSAEALRDTRPEELIRRAVHGMLPKNRLGRQLNTKLKVYVGPDHPHEAQQPQPLEIQT
jgi:large subunit ribosomal protein L13